MLQRLNMTAGRKLTGDYILPLFSHHISVAIVINPQLNGCLCTFLFSKTLSKLKLKTCSWKKDSTYSTGIVQVLVTNTFPRIKKCKLALTWDIISFSNYLVCPVPIFHLFCETSKPSPKTSPCSHRPLPTTLDSYWRNTTQIQLYKNQRKPISDFHTVQNI